MTSFTSLSSIFFPRQLRPLFSPVIILGAVSLVGLSTLVTESAAAKNKQSNTPGDTKKALQDQIDKSNAAVPKQGLYQTDYSREFSYVLPSGWQVTQNPLYPHDILVKQNSERRANIVLADQQAKGNLSKMSKAMVDELPKQCDDFKLVTNEMIKLSSGAICARLMHTGKLGEKEICQVNYLLPYTRGRILVVTGTAMTGDQESLETVEMLASSVTMKKKKLSL